ncbi:alpha/beta hydrolase [Alteromonas sp. 1_MG-2023]|uniref:alpha/beta hydrolase n=1 Tax=Alteromonas sp. 1_MG-2023 TaxID=3062669 RepID=UPI0026E24BE9|nr:alpha/beta hydrolase [Alteromonas sp. 1_MG-2023]MDO6477349.1 alpha/beta hydrolase [Alteromonas sp. 1_MG-2023]
MTIYRVIFLVILILLGGCAAKHVIPPEDYQVRNLDAAHYQPGVKEHIFRVSFDQHGSMYPLYPDHYLFTITPHRIKCRFISCGWSIHSTIDPEGNQPSYHFIDSHNTFKNTLLTKLNTSLEKTQKLVVFIHGFNNDFDAASKNFGLIREKIDMDNITILEVYWDGLDLPIPLFPWAKALTYSNLAGQIGLRGILNGINVHDIELAFITHSRGAAVAVSAISDPIYDDDICAPQETGKHDYLQLCEKQIPSEAFVDESFPRFEPFKSSIFSNINLVFFAPAIGGGHFWSEMNRYLPDSINVNFFVAANEGDYANGKVIGKPGFYGDTSLGADRKEIERYISILNASMPKISLQYLFFNDGFYHGLDDYFNEEDNGGLPECLLWASQLRKSVSTDCKLVRTQ